MTWHRFWSRPTTLDRRSRQNNQNHTWNKKLLVVQLESRFLLAAVMVTTADDVVDGDTLSIEALELAPGADGQISLRVAVMAANNTVGEDSISFAPSLNGSPITLSIAGAGEDVAATGDLDITDSITIQGNGDSNTIIDGGQIDRVLDLHDVATDISDVTVETGWSLALAAE